MNDSSRLVYSTESGRIKPAADKPSAPAISSDGVIRLKRESKGRGGKGVTLITGLPLQESDLKRLAKELKQLCGTGGTVKDGVIEIQGEQREKLKPALEARGYTVKFAGVEASINATIHLCYKPVAAPRAVPLTYFAAH